MIEITQATKRKEEKNKIKGKKGGSSSISHSEKSFQSELEIKIAENLTGTIEEMLNDLRDHEQKFLDSQTLQEMIHYKTVVKKILSIIVSESLQIKSFKRSSKDRADFTIIQKIDEKLLEISNAITRSNKAFNLLKTVEEIRGLICDLVY
jgi:uncharacterized protein YaaR (DUF327 family)